MSIRKMGVIGSFAAGAALALAPMAAAEDPATPPDFSNILVGQVQSMNWLFEAQAAMTGVDADFITKGDPTLIDPLSFSSISGTHLAANEAFASLLYGTNWETEMSSDPGSFSLFNGAMVQFNDANNVLMYALMTGGEQINVADAGDYLFGSDTSIAAALAGTTAWEDASNFFANGIADMGGYFGIEI